MKKYIAALLLTCLMISIMAGCTYDQREAAYYAQQENFVTVSGIVTQVKYNDDKSVLYFAFEDMTEQFSDNSFKIVGENLKIVQQNGIDEKLNVGDEVTFVSAPRYFGDGYVMPIVAISIGEDSLLDYEEGYPNFMEWLQS